MADHRGSAGSSLSAYVHWTRALMSALEIERPILIGLSMGAIVASELVREDPAAYERVILISPPLKKFSRMGPLLLPSLLLLRAVGILAPTFDMLRRRRTFLAAWFDRLISADGDYADEARRISIDALQRADIQAIVQGTIDIVMNRMILDTRPVDGGLYVIVGADDQLASPEAVRHLWEPDHVFVVPNELHGVSRTSFEVVNPIIAGILA